MARINIPLESIFTHEGAPAQHINHTAALRRSVMSCLLWENETYENGQSIADRIAELCKIVEPAAIAEMAVEARSAMHLRHVPLFLVRQLAKRKSCGPLVAETLPRIIQRADELTEYLAIYWKDDAPTERQSISAGSKRGLAASFAHFNEYELAKYNRDNAIKLRDVMFLVHPKPTTFEQASLWKRLANNELATSDTWEVELSAGKDKKATFERLMTEKKLGGLATLRNLRNMVNAGVDENLIRERLAAGCGKCLPFRFITAARYAPQLEDAIEQAMFKSLEGLQPLQGKTGLLIDVSGSMDEQLSNKSEATRVDVAAGLGVLLRELCPQVAIATFSYKAVEVPPRRGFALRDAIHNSQEHGGTNLRAALIDLMPRQAWKNLTRLIVITDEQSRDGILSMARGPAAYVINIASARNGVSYGNGWHHIDGWSERVVDYIQEFEKQ